MCSARISLILFSIFLIINGTTMPPFTRMQDMGSATATQFYNHYDHNNILPNRTKYCNNSTLTAKYEQSYSVVETDGLCFIVWAVDTSTRSDEVEDFAVIYTNDTLECYATEDNETYFLWPEPMTNELFSRWAVNSMSRDDFDHKVTNKSIIYGYMTCNGNESLICNGNLLTEEFTMLYIVNEPSKGPITYMNELRMSLRRFWWKLNGNNGVDYDYNLYTAIVDGKDPFEEEQSSNPKETTESKSKLAPNRLLLSEDQVDGFQALGLTTVAVALVIILYYLIICLVVYTYRNRIFVNFT